MRPIYLDNHATTPVDPRVASVITHALVEAYGNANSVDHAYGHEAAELVEGARREVAGLLRAHRHHVTFTSGASDGIERALRHALRVRAHPSQPAHLALSTVEHRAVLEAVREAEQSGQARVSWIPVDRHARLDLDVLSRTLAQGVDLVCLLAANNEVGTLIPLVEVTRLASEHGALTLIDATQAAGHVDLDLAALGATYLTISAHKLYGPKGVGALLVDGAAARRLPDALDRGGTPNVPGIAGLGEAARLRRLERSEDAPRVAELRDRLQALLLEGLPDLVVNGDVEHRLPHNLHVAVPGVPNTAVTAHLLPTVALSTGAACHSGAQEPSHVLRAMGLSEDLQEGALRMGLSRFTTPDEVERAAGHIIDAITTVRRLLA